MSERTFKVEATDPDYGYSPEDTITLTIGGRSMETVQRLTELEARALRDALSAHLADDPAPSRASPPADEVLALLHRLGSRMEHQAYACDHTAYDSQCPCCVDTKAYVDYLAMFPERRPPEIEGVSIPLHQIKRTDVGSAVQLDGNKTPDGFFSRPMPKPPGARLGHEPGCESWFGYRCTCQWARTQ